jgi:acyl CoA:acetate/3-ketoacid CoA transferase beta subunit
MKVGFIGLGRMGEVMARRLLDAKHEVGVYNRTAEKTKPLVDAGAKRAEPIKAAAQFGDAVFTMLTDDAAVLQVVEQPGGLKEALPKGGIHICAGTHSVGAIQKLKDIHAEAGQILIASPMLGRPEVVAAGNAGIVVGGAPEAVEGWLPYRQHLSFLATGRRHVMMGASQIDRYGNQNISCIGDWARPSRQLLGVRGAAANTANNPTSYWVPRHSARVFVPAVDMVCGIGYDRAAAAGPSATRFHRIPRVVSNLGVFDFETPDRRMRLASVHPGVTVEEVAEATGFALAVTGDVPATREPTAEELRLIREVVDPRGLRFREVPA